MISAKTDNFVVIIALAVCCCSPTARGGVTGEPPSYDFNWALVDRPFNQAFPGPDPFGQVLGRGRVDYVYRISKLEITTRQWMEFANTFTAQPSLPADFAYPSYWGAETVGAVTLPNGTRRFTYGLKQVPGVADTGMAPVAGISWREAAMYCNWLHNNKSSDVSALMSGAYDVSTFGQNGPYFTDQLVRSPGAKFWIPDWNEFLKASYYDPNKFGDGVEGWWDYPTTSDVAPIPGLPGVGQTMAGVPNPPTGGEFDMNWLIPLGAYADVTSPWGLLDVVGGGEEWFEDARPTGGSPIFRLRNETHVMSAGAIPSIHFSLGGGPPLGGAYGTLRIASSVPASGPATAMALALYAASCRRKRHGPSSDSLHPARAMAISIRPCGHPCPSMERVEW